jgi:hypothetical protein
MLGVFVMAMEVVKTASASMMPAGQKAKESMGIMNGMTGRTTM